MFDNRFSWSGEIPLDFPQLNAVALQRITPGVGAFYTDSVEPTRDWERITGGANDGYANGPWGLQMGLNTVNPATDQGGFVLPNFAGLWPSSGKLLMGLWTRQSYTMSFCPLMSTRGGSSPVAYLSTSSTGQIRHQIYNAAGSLVLDQYEPHPWRGTTGYQFVGMLVDYDALTSEMFSVDLASKATWRGPARSLSGVPNQASTANLDIYRLQNSGYWTSGAFDEALVAHPGAGFDLDAFLDGMALGLWSDGQAPANASYFTVTEAGITATGAHAFNTGAERVAWAQRPIVQGIPNGSTAYWSSDNGATWQTGAQLPEVFDGMLRWEVSLASGQTFTGATLTEPIDPPPTLDPLADVDLVQGEAVAVPLNFTVSGLPSWSIVAPGVASVAIDGSTLTVAGGFQVGVGDVTVTLTDELDRSVSQTFRVAVDARPFTPSDPPAYPHVPIIVWDEDEPVEVIIDPLTAVVATETNGEHVFTMTLPATHKHADLLINERRLQVSGETYWIRRVQTHREKRRVITTVRAEPRFYDLATAGRIGARKWNQTTAGDAMGVALQGTGWTVDIANVTTLRTYETQDTNPLALLREVQRNHGGDLLFDNTNRKVSLVTRSGRDNGVSFFYGRGIVDAKRVVDTTSLITRLYARNEDGLTVASVNGGVPYIQDFGFTSEVKVATYEFKSGTSPFTMLAMANATLARRAKPNYSYEITVNDLSAKTGNALDRFGVGDSVTVVDPEVGINTTQRIIRLEYDIVRPWNSGITLSAKLREIGSSDSTDAGTLTTGAGATAFDLVPFNLLLNGRFDNDLAHWAHFGVEVVEGSGTGDQAVKFTGSGERWIEQTVAPDNRDAYALSFDIQSTGPAGWVPNVKAQAFVTYDDGTSETIEIDLS